jgi:hypothetical protein
VLILVFLPIFARRAHVAVRRWSTLTHTHKITKFVEYRSVSEKTQRIKVASIQLSWKIFLQITIRETNKITKFVDYRSVSEKTQWIKVASIQLSWKIFLQITIREINKRNRKGTRRIKRAEVCIVAYVQNW